MRLRCGIGLVILLFVPLACAATPVRILFMHHSTGANLIREGEVREALTTRGYEFWDHGYNDEGLSDARGEPTGLNYSVPDDNTDPDGWAAIFSQGVVAPPSTTFSSMLLYDVVLFKSCFPTSNIADDEMLAAYEGNYLRIRETIDAHPDTLLIAFTSPPLVPNETEPANAARAREWAAYLVSDAFGEGRQNLAIFDFFSLLADSDGVLRREYRSDDWDSHPNETANRTIGPLLVDFADAAVARWRASP